MKNVRLLVSFVAGSVLLGATALAAVDKKAERAWKAKCAACHGQTGKGDTDKGKELKVEDVTAGKYHSKKDSELKKAILDGVKVDGKEVMPPYKNEFTPEQAEALITYTRNTFKK